MKTYRTEILKIREYPLQISDTLKAGIILDGTCILRKAAAQYSLSRQDVFFINRNELFAIRGDCAVYMVSFEPSFLMDTELIDCLDPMDQKKDITITYRDCVFIKHLLSLSESEENLMEVREAMNNDYNRMNNFHHQYLITDQKDRELYESVMRIIHDHYREKISLSDIADRIGIRKNRLANFFHDFTGNTVMYHLNQYRLSVSVRKLVMENMDHERIIKECGFSDRKYYFRYFKETFHDTPNQYRISMEQWRNRDYHKTGSYGKTYLTQLQEELNLLRTDTYFHVRYRFLQQLIREHQMQDFQVCLDLLHPGNYLYADGTLINTWYGFDLINTLLSDYDQPILLAFDLRQNTAISSIDEVLRLLEASASSLDHSCVRKWQFVIRYSSIQQISTVNYIRQRLSVIMKGHKVICSNLDEA
ncbi:MAG: helix-turn-helix domain-containing protein [Bulleidia sp.]